MTTQVSFVFRAFALLFISCGHTGNSSSSELVISADTSTINVGHSPGSVEAADLNNDTFPDLVITSETDSNITILLGDGTGKFKAVNRSAFPAGPAPNDIAFGDFDKDRNMDLALANHETKYITVLTGDGKGSFTPASGSPFPVEGIPHIHGISSGDFNNDGLTDLVTDSRDSDQVEVLFGDSAHLFKPHGVFINVGKRPYQRVRAADVNNDGTPDIVTTNAEGNSVTVLLSDRKGGFVEAPGSPFACGDSPFGLAIGDVNADQMPDLAVVNSPSSMARGSGRNGLTVLLGYGTGKFSVMKGSPFEAGRIPNRVAIGDVDGDGVNDIVTSDNASNKIYMFMMTRSDSVLLAKAITVGNHPKGVAIADLNKDGKGDIVICNQMDDNITILLSK